MQLWVDKEKGQYMVADALLVKFDEEQEIAEVIILESKLSGSTAYTKRQKQGWRKVSRGELLEVKTQKLSENGGNFLNPSDKFSVDNSSVKKISDHGDKEGVLEISDVPVDDWVNYVPIEN